MAPDHSEAAKAVPKAHFSAQILNLFPKMPDNIPKQIGPHMRLMQQNIEFERCIDFLVRMLDKYGDEVLRELEEEKQNKEEKTA